MKCISLTFRVGIFITLFQIQVSFAEPQFFRPDSITHRTFPTAVSIHEFEDTLRRIVDLEFDSMLTYTSLGSIPTISHNDEMIFCFDGDTVEGLTLARALRNDYSIRLFRCTVVGDLDLTAIIYNERNMTSDPKHTVGSFEFRMSDVGSHFTGIVRFDNLALKGQIIFRSSTFHRIASFRNTRFSFGSDINGPPKPAFLKYDQRPTRYWATVFSFCQFKQRANFESANFLYPISFFGSDFSDPCSFDSVAFRRGVDFAFSRMNRASFAYTKFGPDPYEENKLVVDAAFLRASLINSILIGVNLEKVDFSYCKFDNVIYEPQGLPQSYLIETATGLESLTWKRNASPLIKLRNQLREDGFRKAERAVTCAIKRKENERHYENDQFGWYLFNFVLFDLTCGYGMDYGRPLIIAVVLMIICMIIYFLQMHRVGNFGIQKSQDSDALEKKIWHTIRPEQIHGDSKVDYVWKFLRREIKLLWYAGLFSLMSAFNIGFKEFSFGRWLRLVLPTEIDLRPIRWTRTISGIQALLSVGFFALFLLTYFGRLFD